MWKNTLFHKSQRKMETHNRRQQDLICIINTENENSSDKLPVCEFSRPVYQELLKHIVENNFKVPFEDCTTDVSRGVEKGKNFMGVLYRVLVSYRSESKDEKFHLMVKLAPQNLKVRKQLKMNMNFAREAMFYDVVIPMFKLFQEEKGIKIEKEGFFEVPEVLATSTQDHNEGIFMKDLGRLGFAVNDRSDDITFEHVNLVLRALAKFHALSFAIKDQKPELMQKFKNMPDFFVNKDKESRERAEAWYKNLRDEMADSVANHNNQMLKKRVDLFVKQDFTAFCSSMFDEKESEPYAVLTHGDCCIRNMLFRQNAEGAVDDVRLLDFQQMRYASPICDVSFFLFASTNHSLRKKNFKSFLETYYSALSAYIERLGSDPKKVFPRDAFDSHLKKYASFGIPMSAMAIPFIIIDENETVDLDENAKMVREGQSSLVPSKKEFFDEKMGHIFEEMFELGYI